jgi:gliding motility-associated-like protein
MNTLFKTSALVLSLSNLQAQTYFLNGSAEFIGNDCYRLTTTLNTQNGTVWYADQIDLNEPFDLEFLMNFGDLDANGADGIVFVLQTVGTSAIGNNGGGIGYAGFSPSFGIEFDTWYNSEFNDIVQDHIAMISDGDNNHASPSNLAGPVVASALSDNIEDGQNHVVRVVWDPQVGDVEVWFDCELRLIHGVDLLNSIFGGQNLVWWGFTSATGGAVNNQTVCLQENIISVGPNVTICQGASAELVVAGDPDGDYTWAPSLGLDDPTSQTPIASPTSTTVYTVSYTDLCGNVRTDEITVAVVPLEVSIEPATVLNCLEPETELQADNNFNNDVEYSWITSDGEILSGQTTGSPLIGAGGTYSVTANYNGACFDSAEITVEEDFDTYVAEIVPPLNLDCNYPEVEIVGVTNGANNASLTWETTDGNIIGDNSQLNIAADASGTYVFTVTNLQNGCESSAQVSVADNTSYPIAEAGETDTLTCSTPSINISALGSSTGNEFIYEWTMGETPLDGDYNQLPVSNSGWYFLTVSNTENGCSSMDSVLIYFDESSLLDLNDLVVPNIFSPNGDQINDEFRPFLSETPDFDVLRYMDEYEFLVFNRWGNLVFESRGEGKAWDGLSSDGSPVTQGVYYYLVRYVVNCGGRQQDELSGTFTVVE